MTTPNKIKKLSVIVLFSLLLNGGAGAAFASGQYVWTERVDNPYLSKDWYAISSSDDGAKLSAVVYSGYVYTSADSGSTWTEQTSSAIRSWAAITSSADGTKLAAAPENNFIRTSTDSGASWTTRTGSSNGTWLSITSSADGTKLAAGAVNENIYTSADSGATWTEQTGSGSRVWQSITSSDDGTKLAAGVYNGFIYTSSDSGVTWTEQTSVGSRVWYAMTISGDGTKIAAAANGGYIYTSSDSGATWTEQTSSGSRNWVSITSSSDGTKLAAGENTGYIYTSSDSGATWVEETDAYYPFGGWYGVTSSADGSKLAAVAFGGNIWTATLAPDATAPAISSIATSTTQTTASIAWTTDEAATSTVDYGLTDSYGTASSSEVATTSHAYTLTGLTAGTTYHFRISAWDSLQNLATSSDLTFETAPADVVVTPAPDSAPVPAAGARTSVSAPTLSAVEIQRLFGNRPNAVVPLPALKFTRDLQLRSVGADVKALQQFLNSNGFAVAAVGAGSPGKETTYFGEATRRALAQFQKANRITPAIGYFGSITRGVINGWGAR